MSYPDHIGPIQPFPPFGSGYPTYTGGWIPVFAVRAVGERRLVQVLDWVDGVGPKPAVGYLGANGIVSATIDAVDVRGTIGLQGDPGGKGDPGNEGPPGANGWTPVYVAEEDNARRVLRIYDWVDGEGAKPPTGYLGPLGVVPNKYEAVDLRGAQGGQGDKGDAGDEVELQKTATHIQWRYTGGAWQDLILLSDLKGDTGTPNSLAIGTVQSGQIAGANITGTAPNQTLNLTLPKGDQGDPGENVEMQTTPTHIQWRLVGGVWADLVALSDLEGPQGDAGKAVELRKGVSHIQWRLEGGVWADLVPLAEIKGNKGDQGDPGDAVELQTTATHIQWRYTGGAWQDLVLLSSLKGDKGDAGDEVELQKTATHIQWRYTGGSWQDLVLLSALKGDQGDQGDKGDAGDEVELQKTVTHIQWRYTGGAWQNLVLLADLKGDKGDAGNDGWSPLTAVVADGARFVLEITDWTGGAGTKPTTGYVGPTGIVATKAEAVDIRGPAGTGDVSSVNGVLPDGNGDVALAIDDIPLPILPNIKPTLLRDFVNSKSLGANTLSTRASTATYTDAQGRYRTAGINQPRFTYDPVTGEALGLLLEPQATNYARGTEDMYASWKYDPNHYNSAPAESVFGDGHTAVEYTKISVSSPLVNTVGDMPNDLLGRRASVTVLLEADLGALVGDGFRVILYNGSSGAHHTARAINYQAGVGDGISLESLNTFGPNGHPLYRIHAEFEVPDDGDVYRFYIYMFKNIGSIGIVHHGQVTEGHAVQSLIITPTGSQVTRAADNFILPTDSFDYRPDQGTLIVTAASPVGETVAELGAIQIISDSDEMKTYTVSYSSTNEAESLVLGYGLFSSVTYYPRVLP